MERISFKEMPVGLMQAIYGVQEYINKSGLDATLLHLLRMRVSQINGCPYCIDMHFKEGINHGDTALRLISVSVWREVDYYSEREKAVLKFAETLTRLPEDAPVDEQYAELEQYFSKQEIAQLTVAIAQINTWNRLVRSFGTVAGRYEVGKIAA